MRVYVSKGSELYLKWYAFVFFFVWSSAIVYRNIFPIQHYTLELVCWTLLFIPGGALGLYLAAVPSILVVEDDKIVLEGLFRNVEYDFTSFKEVVIKWGTYAICFSDGKSFMFYPESDYNWYYRRSFSEKERLGYINDEIKNIIKEKNREMGFESIEQ